MSTATVPIDHSFERSLSSSLPPFSYQFYYSASMSTQTLEWDMKVLGMLHERIYWNRYHHAEIQVQERKLQAEIDADLLEAKNMRAQVKSRRAELGLVTAAKAEANAKKIARKADRPIAPIDPSAPAKCTRLSVKQATSAAAAAAAACR